MLRNDHEPSRAKFAPLTMNYAGMGPLGQAWETLPFPRSPPASPPPLSGAALCRGREVAGRRFRPFFRIAPWLPGPSEQNHRVRTLGAKRLRHSYSQYVVPAAGIEPATP